MMGYNPEDLVEAIVVIHMIRCDACDVRDEEVAMSSEEDSAFELYKKGWRITSRQKVYCPKCAKKKLKNI